LAFGVAAKLRVKSAALLVVGDIHGGPLLLVD
jgi:hypothetical protein